MLLALKHMEHMESGNQGTPLTACSEIVYSSSRHISGKPGSPALSMRPFPEPMLRDSDMVSLHSEHYNGPILQHVYVPSGGLPIRQGPP